MTDVWLPKLGTFDAGFTMLWCKGFQYCSSPPGGAAVHAATVDDGSYVSCNAEKHGTLFWTDDDSDSCRRSAIEAALNIPCDDKEPCTEPDPNPEFDFQMPSVSIVIGDDPKLGLELNKPWEGSEANADPNPEMELIGSIGDVPWHKAFHPELEHKEQLEEPNPECDFENVAGTGPRGISNPEFEFRRPSPTKSGMILYPWEVDLLDSTTATGLGASQMTTTEVDESLDFTYLKPASPPGQACIQFYVDLERDDARPVGLETRALLSHVTGALRVEVVKGGGLVAEWNEVVERSRYGRPIQAGDFILEVNGKGGSSNILYDAISHPGSLHLLVMRLNTRPRKRSSRSSRSSRRNSSKSSRKEHATFDI
mmetsp:Transcript_1495/g.3546  ORF Transcript_1495/g.3546 Transcript_1495/m.3546 type:complete len:368 (-) Transcript_1495:554-1657(-)